uniref:Uncharacterized protein n=1 Tax=Ixodes ricinus TaxID=34613 RepID=A0A6B0UNG8_IXORI
MPNKNGLFIKGTCMTCFLVTFLMNNNASKLFSYLQKLNVQKQPWSITLQLARRASGLFTSSLKFVFFGSVEASVEKGFAFTGVNDVLSSSLCTCPQLCCKALHTCFSYTEFAHTDASIQV